MLGTSTQRCALAAARSGAGWRRGALRAALVVSIAGGCSSEKPDATTPTSPTSDALTEPRSNGDDAPTTLQPGGSAPPEASTGTSAPAVAPVDSNTTGPLSAGVVEPGVPVVLASRVTFGARLCWGVDDQLYYPNRIGYPTDPGLEELWTVSRDGADARLFAAPGSVTGCARHDDELWVARYDAPMLTQLDGKSGGQRGAFATRGTPLQVANNSSHVFASLFTTVPNGEVVRIDPNTLSEPEVLWSKPGRVTALWLRADDEALLFSARNQEADAAWVVFVQLTSPTTVAELVTTTGELGAVDSAAGYVYYAHYTRGELHQLHVASGVDTVLASLTGIWSLVVDAGHVYFTTRPDYCTNNEGKLYRVAVSGGQPTLLAEGLNCPSQLLIDSRGLYWINTGSWPGPASEIPAPADGSVMFLPRHP